MIYIENLKRHVSNCAQKCYIVPVARACNAKCVFCATSTYRPSQTNGYMCLDNKIYSVIDTLYRCGVKIFEITGGGEPTLHPNLENLIKILRDKHNVSIKLYTNGSNLPKAISINELNISRCTVDPGCNQILMNINQGSLPLKKMIQHARGLGHKNIRLSVPILKGGVQSISDAKDFIKYAAKTVNSIVFRPLYPCTPNLEKINVSNIDNINNWQNLLQEYAEYIDNRCIIEVDTDSCNKSHQLILGSDSNLYTEWTMSNMFMGQKNINTNINFKFD
ncbi:MAG: radical SAM protein [Candidatus Electrothrix communis]|nr:MAG: radical SAM protein [Candidatus Electrothrix communis]